MEGQKVILLEQANAIGTETSSRNSEVIHSGSLPIETVSHTLPPACKVAAVSSLTLHIYIYT